jgi:outer membrane lipopolysaccharide assembly protein LptE/RlpB
MPRQTNPCGSAALVLALFCTGCGYHTVGSASHLPPDVHTIAVKFIENKTQRYHSEIDITQAIVTELQTRTRDKIVPVSEDADATLSGVILNEIVAPYTYNSNTGQTSTYLITLTANITLTDRNNHILYQHQDYQFHQQYEATADLASFIQEDSPAEKRLARDFAQTLVGDILESF